MPGVSFAAPGPADGVGSLASRQVGIPRCQLFGRLCRTARDIRGLVSFPFCHHYYDPLRLPNVHREVLRHPARHSLPVASAFSCSQGIDPAERTSLSGWELWSRGRLPQGRSPHCPRICETGNDEALPSSRAIPVSTWPALRPRWSLVGLANHARRHAAFRLVETVRVHRLQVRHLPPAYPHGPRLSNNFRGSITHPADLLDLAHDLCLLRPQGSATGLVASLCPGRTSTSWITKPISSRQPTSNPKVTDLPWRDNVLVMRPLHERRSHP